jgi:hypothetical protein
MATETWKEIHLTQLKRINVEEDAYQYILFICPSKVNIQLQLLKSPTSKEYVSKPRKHVLCRVDMLFRLLFLLILSSLTSNPSSYLSTMMPKLSFNSAFPFLSSSYLFSLPSTYCVFVLLRFIYVSVFIDFASVFSSTWFFSVVFDVIIASIVFYFMFIFIVLCFISILNPVTSVFFYIFLFRFCVLEFVIVFRFPRRHFYSFFPSSFFLPFSF